MNVLVATDGSDHAQQAVRFAAHLAAQVRGSLFACYAVDYVSAPAFLSVPRTLERPPDLLRDQGLRALESARELAGVYGVEPVTQLAEGPTVDALLRYAHEIEADALVVGTRGRPAPAAMLLGSTALDTIRQSNRPLIVVPPHVNPAFSDIRRIAVAVDGSAPARRAFQAACRLARACDASLELCHGIDHERVAQSEDADARTYAAQLLTTAALEAAQAGIGVRKRILEGYPAAAIAQWAVQTGCGLIAMGSHARTGMQRIVAGSVTEAVLRASTVPVLVCG